MAFNTRVTFLATHASGTVEISPVEEEEEEEEKLVVMGELKPALKEPGTTVTAFSPLPAMSQPHIQLLGQLSPLLRHHCHPGADVLLEGQHSLLTAVLEGGRGNADSSVNWGALVWVSVRPVSRTPT